MIIIFMEAYTTMCIRVCTQNAGVRGLNVVFSFLNSFVCECGIESWPGRHNSFSNVLIYFSFNSII